MGAAAVLEAGAARGAPAPAAAPQARGPRPRGGGPPPEGGPAEGGRRVLGGGRRPPAVDIAWACRERWPDAYEHAGTSPPVKVAALLEAAVSLEVPALLEAAIKAAPVTIMGLARHRRGEHQTE